MILEIDDGKTIGDLQERFNNSFPELRLEFFDKSHGWNGRSSSKPLSSENKISDIRHIHEPGTLQIFSTDKVGEIERILKKHFGLFAQIYYKRNNEWIERGDTDDYTLSYLSSGLNT